MSQLPEKVESFTSVHQDNLIFHIGQPILALEDKPRPMAEDTQQGEKHDSLKDFLQSRTHQSFALVDVSFGKNFLAQHIKALHQICASKPIESSPPANIQLNSRTLPPLHKTSILSPNKSSTSSLLDLLEASRLDMTPHEIIRNLKYQPDLDAFLNYVIEHVERGLATSLVVLAVNLLGEVRNIDFRDLEISDLRIKAASWTKQKGLAYFQRPDFQELKSGIYAGSHQPESDQLFQKFAEKLRYYITTVLLILAGYFQNPYVGESSPQDCFGHVDYPKRQFSEANIDFLSRQDIFSDSEDVFQPTKRLKKQ